MTDIYVSENWIVISGDNTRRGYDKVKSYDKSYDKIKNVTMSVNRNFNMLVSEITTGKVVKKLDCSSIDEIST